VSAVSKDYGQSWNNAGSPVSDNAHPFNQGSQVQYGPDGALYVAYEGSSPTTGFATDAMVLARSTDDGKTFVTKELARVYDDLDCYPVYAGRQTLTDMHFRLNSYPSMSVDPVSGMISLVWSDQQGSGNCGNGGSSFSGTTSNQVRLIRSTWAGIESAAVTNVTSGADTVFPSVASYNGRVVISYYTRSYAIGSAANVCHWRTNDLAGGRVDPSPSTASVCLDYAAKTWTVGGGLSSQRRLSNESSNPFVQFANGSFIGDYTQVAMGTDGKAHASWTDFRGNPGVTSPNQDVLIANFTP
jgi:hypothetical protein